MAIRENHSFVAVEALNIGARLEASKYNTQFVHILVAYRVYNSIPLVVVTRAVL